MLPFVDLPEAFIHREGLPSSRFRLVRGVGAFVRTGTDGNEEGLFGKGIVDRIRVVLEPRVSVFVLIVWCWEPDRLLAGIRVARERRGVSALEESCGLYLGTGHRSFQFVHVDAVGALPWRPEMWRAYSEFGDPAQGRPGFERRTFGLARSVRWNRGRADLEPAMDLPPCPDIVARFAPLPEVGDIAHAALLARGLVLAGTVWARLSLLHRQTCAHLDTPRRSLQMGPTRWIGQRAHCAPFS